MTSNLGDQFRSRMEEAGGDFKNVLILCTET